MSRKRVARLMGERGLAGVSRRTGVERHFQADAPDKLSVADITDVPLVSGAFVSLAIVLDVFSRRVLGRAMGPHLPTTLILAALNGFPPGKGEARGA